MMMMILFIMKLNYTLFLGAEKVVLLWRLDKVIGMWFRLLAPLVFMILVTFLARPRNGNRKEKTIVRPLLKSLL